MNFTKMLCFAVVALLVSRGHAESSIVIRSLSEFRHRISTDSMSQQERHLLALPCSDLDSRLSYASLTAGSRYGVLEVFSKSTCDQEVLLVFKPLNASWSLVSRLDVRSYHNHSLRISFPSLLDKAINEILIEHQEIDAGTGSLQLNTTVYKWVGNRLQPVLDAPEYVDYNQPQNDTRYKVEQRSRFLFTPVEQSGTNNPKPIVEERNVQVNGSSTNRWLQWSWDPFLGEFRSTECSPKCE